MSENITLMDEMAPTLAGIWLKLLAEAEAFCWCMGIYGFLWVYHYMNKCVRQHFCSGVCVRACV